MTYAKAAVAAILAALTVLATLVTPHSVVWVVASVIVAGVAAFQAVYWTTNQPPKSGP